MFRSARILLLCTLVSVSLSTTFAQISEDFSDGDFTQNPTWTGDAANFIVNDSGQLQLNAPDAGASLLELTGNFSDSAEWRMDVLLAFDPSTTNRLRIYLLADQADLLLANGYYLEIGVSGTADSLRFFRQDGAARTLLAAGPTDLVQNDTVNFSLWVRRSAAGLWTAETTLPGGSFQPEFTASDAVYGGGAGRFFGFHCLYTATRRDKFFFDNLLLPIVPDTVPPVLLSAQADNATQVTAYFNEVLDSLSALSPAHYVVSGLGQPASAAFVPGDLRAVRLTWSAPMPTGSYQLQVDQIADSLGNIAGVQTADFQFINIESATQFDLIINEIMADPSPPAGLPEVEWFEIYNRSGKYIDLQSVWVSEAGGVPQQLSDYVLAPDSFIVLCSPAAAVSLAAAAPNVLAVPNFPTLNNTSDWLILATPGGEVINQVAYEVNWHTDPDKADGGWSLERINPVVPCLGAENWQSCPVLPGGTPGRANASLQTAPDTTAPRLLAVAVENATALELTFSEGLDLVAAENPAFYYLVPTRQIASAGVPGEDRSVVRLDLAEPLEPGVRYALSVAADLKDCSGNAAATADTVSFGLPETPVFQDILINEIMADPTPTAGLPEVEWIELYNRSGKFIDLKTVLFGESGGAMQPLPAYLLAPDSFVVLCPTAAAAVLGSSAPNVLATPGFPTLNDGGDWLILSNLAGEVVNQVVYNVGWHTIPGRASGGWSLERINPTLPCLGAENWQTCPAATGGGTPGRANASLQTTPDLTPPMLLSAFPENATTVRLRFSEGLDRFSAEDPAAYQFSPSRQVASAGFPTAEQSLVELILDEPLEPGVVYAITVTSDLSDCSGNSAATTDTAFVGLPEKPDPQDIVVNEILCNPATGGSRYVEFYNRSAKIFNLAEFSIANFNGGSDTEPIDIERLFLPGEYLVFTERPLDVATHFAGVRPDWLLEQALPSLADDTDNVTLFWAKSGQVVVVDSLFYSDDWHNALLTTGDRDGVALERIRPDGPTNAAANWTSAATPPSGAPGTPTQPNSQLFSAPALTGDDLIQLPSPARISPDDDGFEDFLAIGYRMPEPGYAATITIYDSDGIPIKHLVRQDLIGTEGALRWDGDTDDGSRARPGIHILFAEVFAPTGEVWRVKKAFAVVARF